MLQSVQFVTVQGKRLAVLSADDFEALIEWLETIEDSAVVQEARRQLQAAEYSRDRAGWHKWDGVERTLV